MKVKLYKKVSDSWSGTTLYANCKHYIGSYLTRTGARYTGLDRLDQERLEKLLGEDLSPNSSYWDEFRIIIKSTDEDGIDFDTSDPFDELRVRFLENHKRVGKGYTDRKMGTDYVLVKEEQAAKELNKKAKVKIEVMKAYSDLTPDEMRKALRLYGHKSDNISMEIAESTLFTLIEEDPKKFKEIWIDNPYRDTQFLIEEAVANNVIRKNKTLYKYGTDLIGNSIEDAIDYLRNPANANLRIAIKSQVEGKRVVEKPTEEREIKSQVSKILEEPDEMPDEEPKEEIKEEVKEEKPKKKVTKPKKK